MTYHTAQIAKLVGSPSECRRFLEAMPSSLTQRDFGCRIQVPADLHRKSDWPRKAHHCRVQIRHGDPDQSAAVGRTTQRLARFPGKQTGTR